MQQLKSDTLCLILVEKWESSNGEIWEVSRMTQESYLKILKNHIGGWVEARNDNI